VKAAVKLAVKEVGADFQGHGALAVVTLEAGTVEHLVALGLLLGHEDLLATEEAHVSPSTQRRHGAPPLELGRRRGVDRRRLERGSWHHKGVAVGPAGLPQGGGRGRGGRPRR